MSQIHTYRLLLIVTCLVLAIPTTHSTVQIFKREQAEIIFKQRKQTLMLLLGDQDQSSATFEAVSDASSQHHGTLFTYSKVGEEPYSKLIELIGVHKLTPPVLVFFDNQGDKFVYKIDTHGPINVRNIDKFLNNVFHGAEDVFMKSDQSYEDISPEERAENKKYMQYFTAYTLDSTRQHSQKDIIVLVYASWCMYSAQLAPTFREVAKRLKPNRGLVFGKLEGPANQIRQYQPVGYPSILYWGENKQAQPLVYFGDRSADDIIDWIKSKTEKKWVEPLPAEPKIEKIQSEQL